MVILGETPPLPKTKTEARPKIKFETKSKLKTEKNINEITIQ